MATVGQDDPHVGRGLFGARSRRAKLADVVAEGIYVAAAATRLTLKNRILVDILAGGRDYDVETFVPDARAALLTLAQEAEADAERAEREGRRASRRHSESDGTHDYRSRDVRNLRRRRKQSEQVAAELRARADDPDELHQLVETAREAAWAEVSRNIDRTLRIEAARPDLEPDYEALREARMQALRLVDLPRLRSHRRQQQRGKAGELPSPVADAASRRIDLSELE